MNLAVEFIMELLAEGISEEEILENYPRITHEDIAACRTYASRGIEPPPEDSELT